MTIDLTGLVRPHLVEMTKRDDNPNAAEFRLQPLERGFGYTLGNSLRRLLLSSLRGSAVWGFRLDGVVHEHQTVQGVLEDVHQIVQRLKALTLVLAEDVDEAVLHIRRDGAGPGLRPRHPGARLRHREEPRPPAVHPPGRPRGLHGAVREQGPGLRRGRDAPGRPVAAGRPGPHRRHLQSGPARQLRRRRDPRRPAHRLRPAHGPGRDQRHHHAGRRHRLRGGPGPGPLPVLRGLRQGAHHAGRGRGGRAPATAPTCASASPGRSTTSASRSARSTRSRTRTSGPSRIWSSSARTICSRSRTWARRR